MKWFCEVDGSCVGVIVMDMMYGMMLCGSSCGWTDGGGGG